MPFVAIGYFYVIDTAEYNKAIAKNRNTIISDFKNYINIQPVVQISEIKQVGYNNLNNFYHFNLYSTCRIISTLLWALSFRL